MIRARGAHGIVNLERRSLKMYGVVTAVPAPVEIYDRMHAELIKRAGTPVDGLGLLVHVGRATDQGFERFEVWESKEHYDRAMEMTVSLMRELAADLPQPSTEQSTEVFEVRGIVIPRGDIVI
jgi:hypothetical protein